MRFDAMMTVIDLAKQSGVTPHAVRYYTQKGLLTPSRNPDNGYRQYKPSEVSWMRFIHQAKGLGYTLKEIQEIMQNRDKGQSPCPKVREILQRRIMENKQQLQELLALKERMETALEEWSMIPDGTPDGHSVCHLIESVCMPGLETENMQ